jgi:putative acetyltransferase
MISRVTLAGDGAERRVASLSPLAVAPVRQREGIGSALVRAACARAAELGDPSVILEGDPAYYGSFGFEPGLRYGIAFDLPSWAPPEAGQVLWLSAHDTTLRGRVVYPPSFAGVVEHDQ